MTLYLDASALVKRYVEEPGSDLVVELMDRAKVYKMCRVGFVETVGAVDRAGGVDGVEAMKSDWSSVDVVEVDRVLADHAAALAVNHRLRALDALHLAAALTLAHDIPIFVTWDRDLHRAAREEGLRTLPATLD